MGMPRTRTTTHYVVVILRHARRLGLDVDNIINDIGIPLELSNIEDKWISNDRFAALVKRLWQETKNESFGLDPVPMRIGSWALACDFMLTAETLGELYRRGEHIFSYLSPDSSGLNFTTSGDTASIFVKVYAGEQDPSHFLAEFMTVVWHRFANWTIDENIQLQKAFFSYPRPHHSHVYDQLFQCDLEFDQEQIGFSFSKKYLDKKITRTRPELKNWLQNSPADLLYLPGKESSIKSQIVKILAQYLHERRRFPSFESVCSDLFLGPQAVRRRLADEGSSYQQIKDSLRQSLARQLLTNPEIPILEISQRTGFTEPAAFSRAFKKWTGANPAEYRKGKQSMKSGFDLN
tara:strand:+ start:3868 stop:4914 length:1047 start_codon:yes stop_codon:yes gene_type:complete